MEKTAAFYEPAEPEDSQGNVFILRERDRKHEQATGFCVTACTHYIQSCMYGLSVRLSAEGNGVISSTGGNQN